MEKLKAKDFKSIIKATFPKYRKRSVYIKASDTVTFYDLNWSGGTKADYRACKTDGTPLERQVDMGMMAPWENPYEGKTVNIPKGCVVVEGGFFCGKERILYITFNPLDAPRQITA